VLIDGQFRGGREGIARPARTSGEGVRVGASTFDAPANRLQVFPKKNFERANEEDGNALWAEHPRVRVI